MSADTYYTVDVSGISTKNYITLDGNEHGALYSTDDYGDFTIQTTGTESSLKVGKQTLTEQKLEKLLALLDVIDQLEDDNELKIMLDAQLGFNKIRGDNESKSN